MCSGWIGAGAAEGLAPLALHTQLFSVSHGSGKLEGKPQGGRNAGSWPLQVWGP